MPIIYAVLALVVVAIVAWFARTHLSAAGSVQTILNIVLALIVLGTVLWLVNTYVPMAGSIKAILNIFVVVATCVVILKALGLWGELVRLWSNFTGRLNAR
jgi:hypothetical protein